MSSWPSTMPCAARRRLSISHLIYSPLFPSNPILIEAQSCDFVTLGVSFEGVRGVIRRRIHFNIHDVNSRDLGSPLIVPCPTSFFALF